jgi:hypothetical protein
VNGESYVAEIGSAPDGSRTYGSAVKASAVPAMALNTFQQPLPGIFPQEEPPGPPSASGGPAAGSLVFHCDHSVEVAHTIPQLGLLVRSAQVAVSAPPKVSKELVVQPATS